jgi:hypothetical protein
MMGRMDPAARPDHDSATADTPSAPAPVTGIALLILLACSGVIIAWYTASAGAGITAAVPVAFGLGIAALSVVSATRMVIQWRKQRK